MKRLAHVLSVPFLVLLSVAAPVLAQIHILDHAAYPFGSPAAAAKCDVVATLGTQGSVGPAPIFPIRYAFSINAGAMDQQIQANDKITPIGTSYTVALTCTLGAQHYNSTQYWEVLTPAVTVDVAGATVTRTAGIFPFGRFVAGDTVVINGVPYLVQAAISDTVLTLTTSAGTQTAVAMTWATLLHHVIVPNPPVVSNSGINPLYLRCSIVGGCYAGFPLQSGDLPQLTPDVTGPLDSNTVIGLNRVNLASLGSGFLRQNGSGIPNTTVAPGDAAAIGTISPRTAAVARTQASKNADIVSITDFGASPSATPLDNSTAIQDALDSGAGTILVPLPGPYTVLQGTLTIPANTRVLCQSDPGAASVTITIPNASTTVNLSAIFKIGGNGASIWGCNLDGNSSHNASTQYYAVDASGYDDVSIEQSSIANITTVPIWASPSGNRLVVKNNRFSNYGIPNTNTAAVYIENRGTPLAVAGATIVGNVMDGRPTNVGCIKMSATLGSVNTGLVVDGNTCFIGDAGLVSTLGIEMFGFGVTNGYFQGARLSGNKLIGENNTNTHIFGISSGACLNSDIDIYGNTIINTRQVGIEMFGNNINAHGNTLTGAGRSYFTAAAGCGTSYGSHFSNNIETDGVNTTGDVLSFGGIIQSCKIEGNTFRNSAATAINLTPLALGGATDGCLIGLNTIIAPSNSAIVLSSASTNNTITNNQIYTTGTADNNGAIYIEAAAATGNTIINNKIYHAHHHGIYVLQASDHTTIIGNTVDGSLTNGINVALGDRHRVINNTLTNNGSFGVFFGAVTNLENWGNGGDTNTGGIDNIANVVSFADYISRSDVRTTGTFRGNFDFSGAQTFPNPLTTFGTSTLNGLTTAWNVNSGNTVTWSLNRNNSNRWNIRFTFTDDVMHFSDATNSNADRFALSLTGDATISHSLTTSLITGTGNVHSYGADALGATLSASYRTAAGFPTDWDVYRAASLRWRMLWGADDVLRLQDGTNSLADRFTLTLTTGNAVFFGSLAAGGAVTGTNSTFNGSTHTWGQDTLVSPLTEEWRTASGIATVWNFYRNNSNRWHISFSSDDTIRYQDATAANADRFVFNLNGTVQMPNIPTSCSGQPTKTLWSNAGVVSVCP